MDENAKDPSKRVAGHRLANEVCTMVHGRVAVQQVVDEQALLFPYTKAAAQDPLLEPAGSSEPPPTLNTNMCLTKKAPQVNAQSTLQTSLTLPVSIVREQPLGFIFFLAKLAISTNEGHRLIAAGGAYVGSTEKQSVVMSNQQDTLFYVRLTPNMRFEDIQRYCIIDDGQQSLVLRVGKWKTKIIRILPEEQFFAERQSLEKTGQLPPDYKDRVRATILKMRIRLGRAIDQLAALEKQKELLNAHSRALNTQGRGPPKNIQGRLVEW
jgi:tyrosyl-tRNA synthetase